MRRVRAAWRFYLGTVARIPDWGLVGILVVCWALQVTGR